MKKYLKPGAIALAFLVSLGFIVAGCAALTPEQEARIAKIVQEVGNIRSEIAEVAPDLEKFSKLIVETTKKIADGEIPKEEGKQLLEFYKAKKDLAKEKIARLKGSMETIEAEKAKLEAEGVSTWRTIGEVGLGLLLSALGVNRQLKLGGVTKAFGIVSRVTDATGGATGEAPPEMRREIDTERKRVKLPFGVLKDLHAEARRAA